MKIIGPLNDNRGLHLVAFNKDSLTVIKLRFKSILIQALNNQVPLFYSNHFEELLNSSLEKLKDNYTTETFLNDEIIKIEVQKSKMWTHKLIIQLRKKEIKLALTERGIVGEYEQIISEWQNGK